MDQVEISAVIHTDGIIMLFKPFNNNKRVDGEELLSVTASACLCMCQFPSLLYCRFQPAESAERVNKWSSATIANSLKVRVATGISGYEYLRKGMSPRLVMKHVHISYKDTTKYKLH